MKDSIIDKPIFSDQDRLINTLNLIPRTPGCYLYKDNENKLLYVGKSKNLRSRIRSYFRDNKNHSPRIALMVMQIYDIEVIITDTESEALSLESNLIKSHQPYFNVLLKDDKKYPYLCITWSEDYPRIFVTRKRRQRIEKDKYYGPYVDVGLLRETLMLIKKIFPLRQRPRPLYKNRTCLNYDIGKCPGVCQQIIDSETYKKTIKEISMIFEGRTDALNKYLNIKMTKLSDQMDYEKAALVRDQIKSLDKLVESQKVSLPDSSITRDIIGLSEDNGITSVQIFQMRSGRLVGRLGYIYHTSNIEKDTLLQKVIEEHYSLLDPVEMPPEILIPFEISKLIFISKWLSNLSSKRVKLKYPKISSKAELLSLVESNAHLELKRAQDARHRTLMQIEDLTQIIELNEPPRRIECYDISHIQGSDAVASQVVFIDGVPSKQNYRKYKIKNSDIKIGYSDDYISLAEVIKRRFKRWSEIKSSGVDLSNFRNRNISKLANQGYSDWPDLIVIDGGKGQLNAVMKALKELSLDDHLNVCSLAKRHEEVYVPCKSQPLDTEENQPGLILLRKLRDEAHRFALSYHRKKRDISMKRSHLVEIPGVGPKRIKSLLAHFKSIQAIQLATIDEISRVNLIGIESATEIWKYFHPDYD